jgi:protein-arginine kinase activator protein McsA
MPKKNTLRKQARKSTSAIAACQSCGATEALERHHPDYSRPDIVEVLCPPCHVTADLRDGTRKAKAMRACAHCGKEFLPTHSKKHMLCSPECRSAVGRMNAEKRWGKSGQKNRT